MTEQEVLKNIEARKEAFPLDDSVNIERTKEYPIVKKALEIRIPKKPLTETVNRGIDVSGEYDISYNYLCPTCNAVVGNFETEDIWCNFCDNCGQAIDRTLDWSDKE